MEDERVHHTAENFETFPRPHFIDSPRSLEACARLGLLPEELYASWRSATSTVSLKQREKDDTELEELRKTHRERRRQAKLQEVRNERLALLGDRQGPRVDAPGHAGALTDSEALEKEVQQLKAGILELEEKRHQAIRRRQDRELKRAMENEQRLGELAMKIAHAEAQEQQRRLEHDKEVAERRAAAAKANREREVEKKAREDAEDEARREMTRREKEQEAKMMAANKKKTAERAKEAAEKEAERLHRAAEQQEHTQALIRAQEEQAERARAEMEAREARVMAQLEEKMRAKAIEVETCRAAAEKRIQVALERNRKIQDDKKARYNEKQQAVAQRNAETAAREAEEAQKNADEQDRIENKRMQRLDDSYAAREARRLHIIQRRMQREQFYAKVAAERARDAERRRVLAELCAEDKKDAVERLQRLEHEHQARTLQRIDEETQRSEQIKQQREFMVQQRRQAANQAMIRKHKVKDAMDRLQQTAVAKTKVDGASNRGDSPAAGLVRAEG